MADASRATITGKLRSTDGELLTGRMIATTDGMFTDGEWVIPRTSAAAEVTDGVVLLEFDPGDVSATLSFRDLRAGTDRVKIAPFHVKLSAGQEVDLADLLPAQADSGRTIVVDPATADRAEAAAARAIEAAVRAEMASGGGPGGSAGVEISQPTPLATWSIPHGFGRRPAVVVYDVDGAQIDPDIDATALAVTVTFPAPAAGSVVLS